MGYLDNSTITVDAIITNKGRELLSRGKNYFEITKFALADDEIDYGLWNPAHPLGSDYYGIAIESLPLVEAIPDETYTMRYKLFSMPKTRTKVPVLDVSPTQVVLRTKNQKATITPSTSNGYDSSGYTAILTDNTMVSLSVPPGSTISGYPTNQQPSEGASPTTVFAVGKKFTVTALYNPFETRDAKLFVYGNNTGAMDYCLITLMKMTTVDDTLLDDNQNDM